jgi:hypothetical protein
MDGWRKSTVYANQREGNTNYHCMTMCVSLQLEEGRCWGCAEALKVKYGVRSPKFFWAPCHVMCTAVLIGWDPATSPSPCIWAHIRGARYWSAKIDDISL